jgi:hypothetical protein
MSAQLTRILARLEAHRHIFDFDRDGLGVQMTQTIADDILQAARSGGPPTGGAWAPLSPGYESWKVKHYPGAPIGVQTGHMLSPPQVVGTSTITADRIVQTYGLDPVADDHANWFQHGRSNQPARPFYRFGPIGLARLQQLLEARFHSMI